MAFSGVWVVFVCALVARVSGAAVRGEMDGQIVGGRRAGVGEFPHQASMQMVLREGWYDVPKHLCGGTLILPGWVLTAAHCVHAVPPEAKRVEVLLGSTSINPKAKQQAGAQRIVVSEMIVHEGYDAEFNGGVGPNDIALLRLAAAARLSDVVKTARLPTSKGSLTGEAVLSGWGAVDGYHWYPKMSDDLLAVTLPIVEFDECHKFIGNAAPSAYNPLVNTNVCTGPLDRAGISSCTGDSGGPLVQKAEGETVVVGVVSWGLSKCGTRPYPSIYTRVAAFAEWITAKTSNQ